MKRQNPPSEQASPQTTAPAPPGNAKPLPPRRRMLYRLLALTVVPTLLLLLVEATLRVAGYGYDPRFFKKLTIQGEPFLVQNEDFSRRFFPPETLRHPIALRMHAVKPPDTIRIFILGESAAMGDPEPTYGPSRYLEALLWERFPERDFEVINVAFTAINSHVILPLARECATHDGDIWIVYMGNNEMVGPFGAATVFGLQAPPRPLARASMALQRLRLGQWMTDVSRQLQRPPTLEKSWGGMEMFTENRVAPDSPKREVVAHNFDANLQDILQAGLESGAAVILNTVAVNLRDAPPFASMNNPALSPRDLDGFQQLFAAGVAAQSQGGHSNAATSLRKACQLDPWHAEAHYRQAVSMEQIGLQQQARGEYQRACDTDALPFRTDSRLNTLIRRAGEKLRNEGVRLIEAPQQLATASPAGICGEESFHEHVHFNFEGAYRLAQAWAEAVEEQLEGPVKTAQPGTPHVSETKAASNPWPSQAQCDKRIALTELNRKLVLQSVAGRLQSPPLSTQYNNRERLQRLTAREQALFSNPDRARVDAATRVYLDAIHSKPGDYYLHESFGLFLQSIGNRPAAIEQWRTVGKLLPHDFLPWFQMGSLLSQKGDYAASERNLRKALSLRPTLLVGWSELGQCLGAQNKWEESVDAFDRALTLRPGDPALHAYKARALQGTGREDEAIQAYRQALRLNPDYWKAHVALGDLFAANSSLKDAVIAYEAAIRCHPEFAVAHFNLAVVHLQLGDIEQAVDQLEQTLALAPDHAKARDYLPKARRLLLQPQAQP